jgi:class 3 adenylate cyclase
MTSDGVQIAYAVEGEGPGTPLLCLPAAPFTNVRTSPWGGTLPLLTTEEGARASRPTAWLDFRGCGLSERRVDDVSMRALERDLDAVVERLGWPRFSLLAMGMPGPIAMKYAAEHPDRMASLVLRETYARAADMGRIPRVRSLGLLLREDWESYLMLMAVTSYGWSSNGARLMKFLADCATQEMVRAYAAATPTFDASMFVDQIRARTLVVGRDDMPVPSGDMLRQLGARIRDARVVMASVSVASGNPADVVEPFLAEGDAAPTAPGTPAPRRMSVVFFTDLVGHTEMMQRLGDDHGRDVLRAHERITRNLLRQYGGAEVKAMGDGFMASFASIMQATECAIALQRAFAEHSEAAGEPLSVRVGLNAGEPIEEDGDLFGATVILASRIAAKATGGQILIPEPVRHLLSGKTFSFSERGEFALKGFEEAVRLYEVRWRE